MAIWADKTPIKEGGNFKVPTLHPGKFHCKSSKTSECKWDPSVRHPSYASGIRPRKKRGLSCVGSGKGLRG